MKIEWNRKYTTIAIYAFLVVAGGIVFFHVMNNLPGIQKYLGMITNLLIPFIYGGTIAYILNPVLRWLEEFAFPKLFGEKVKKKNRRRLGVLLSFSFAFALIGLFFSIVLPQIVDSIRSVVAQSSYFVQSIERTINQLIAQYGDNPVVSQILTKLYDSTESIMQQGYQILSQAVPLIANTFMSIANSLLNVIVGLIIAVYVLLAKETFAAQIRKLLYACFPKTFVENVLVLAHDSNTIFCGFISGKILDSFIIGLICFAGMSLLKLPYVMLVSVIVGVTNVIPYFGPFIGAIPSIILIFFVSPIQAIYFAIFVLLLQQLDGNVIGPKILGDSTGLSAFWVIFAVTFFGGLFGFVGMLIGVPTFAVIYSLIRRWTERRLRLKDLKTETNAYLDSSLPLENGAVHETKQQ